MLSPWSAFYGGTPVQGFRFFVMFVDNNRIPRVFDTRFSKVSGISVGVEEKTFQSGGQTRFANRTRSVKSVKYNPLVLTRGMPMISLLRMELEQVIQYAKRSTFSIFLLLLDESGLPSAAWQFERARPVKWQISEFDASNSGPVIETIELSYERYNRLL